MRTSVIWFAGLWMGCQPIEPSDARFPPTRPPEREVATPTPAAAAPAPSTPSAPVAPTPVAPAASPSAATTPVESGAPPAAGEAKMTDEELMAIAMGVDPATLPKKDKPAADLPLPIGLPGPGAPPPPPRWQPGAPLPGGWGVRLVQVVADAQPPRAVLGLADGREVVVQPGAMLVDERVVVTAIGRDAVQIAHVEPQGDHVQIRNELLQPLYGKPAVAPTP